MEKTELVALLSLSSWCLVIVVWLFLAGPWLCLQFVIVVFPDHTHFFLFCKSTFFNHGDRKCVLGLGYIDTSTSRSSNHGTSN